MFCFSSYFDRLQQNVGSLADVLSTKLPALEVESEKKVCHIFLFIVIIVIISFFVGKTICFFSIFFLKKTKTNVK